MIARRYIPEWLDKYSEAGPVVPVHPVVEGGEDEVRDAEDGDEERGDEQELELVDDGRHVGEARRQEDAGQGEEEGRVAQEPVREVEEPPPAGDNEKEGKVSGRTETFSSIKERQASRRHST